VAEYRRGTGERFAPPPSRKLRGAQQAAVQAQWWPMPLRLMPTTSGATGGVYNDVMNTPMSLGTVLLVRQKCSAEVFGRSELV
jgi:hypothetical protein